MNKKGNMALGMEELMKIIRLTLILILISVVLIGIYKWTQKTPFDWW